MSPHDAKSNTGRSNHMVYVRDDLWDWARAEGYNLSKVLEARLMELERMHRKAGKR